MGFYSKHVLPRIIEAGGGTKYVALERQQCLGGVSGRVLEVGFGTGHNLPHYPPGVTELVGVDPSGPSAKLARKRIAAAPFPVQFIQLDGEQIPAPDASFDAVVCTFALCTIPDPGAALRHMRRVLRPGGSFFFLEHGRSDEPNVRRWQERLNGLQKRLFGGCHVNREIDRLIVDAGFVIDRLDKHYAAHGPRALSYLYRGVARRAS